jgi:hypothetical protein
LHIDTETLADRVLASPEGRRLNDRFPGSTASAPKSGFYATAFRAKAVSALPTGRQPVCNLSRQGWFAPASATTEAYGYALTLPPSSIAKRIDLSIDRLASSHVSINARVARPARLPRKSHVCSWAAVFPPFCLRLFGRRAEPGAGYGIASAQARQWFRQIGWLWSY